MRYPDFLKQNGTIGFVAPSFGCATEPYKSAFDNAIKKFNAMGYDTVEGSNCRVEKGIGISNTPANCGAELNAMYTNDKSDVIISCGGGELMCEVVPYIDFDLISKSKPKWYMGFSDNTNFTFLSATLADTAVIYGPCASTFGMEQWHESVHDAFDLLCGQKTCFSNYDKWEIEQIKDEDHPLVGYNLTEKSCIKAYIKNTNAISENEKCISELKQTGADDSCNLLHSQQSHVTMRGRLLGGCLDCLVNLAGTEFDKVTQFDEKYKDDGIIWFLESCELNVMSMRRSIWNLKQSGWFKYTKGFLIGRPMLFNDEGFGVNHYSAVLGALEEFDVPIIMDLDIGHLPPMMPIVTGAIADVNFDNGKFTVKYDFEN